MTVSRSQTRGEVEKEKEGRRKGDGRRKGERKGKRSHHKTGSHVTIQSLSEFMRTILTPSKVRNPRA